MVGNQTDFVYVPFPGIAPAPVPGTNVNFASGLFGDGDATCTGNVDDPTAPAGKVCLYLSADLNVDRSQTRGLDARRQTRGFRIRFEQEAIAMAGDDKFLDATWAYTAP